MTRQEFFEKYRPHLANMALRGLVFDTDVRMLGQMTAGQYALRIPEKVDQLIVQLWADAQPLTTISQNGKPEAKREPAKP